MMTYCYDEKGAARKEKEEKREWVIAILFLTLLIAAFTLFLVFATYEKRILFMIIGSVTIILLFGGALYAGGKAYHERKLLAIYHQILAGKEETIEGVLQNVGERPITLPDGSFVYEIQLKGRVFYWPAEEAETPVSGHQYRLLVVENRVKGHEPLS